MGQYEWFHDENYRWEIVLMLKSLALKTTDIFLALLNVPSVESLLY